MSIARAHFILYVRDQWVGAGFYRRVLAIDPTLDDEAQEIAVGDRPRCPLQECDF